jgi:membrane-associated phospholipid phosphatase
MLLFLKNNRHLLAILTVAAHGLIYLLIGGLAGPDAVSVNSAIDDRIPYVSWFVIFYAAWIVIPYISLLYLGLTNRSLYWRTLIIYNAAVMVCNIIFIVYPTHMPRPDIAGDSLFDRLVLFIYSNDRPVNCFPSIHCLTSYLLFVTMNRHRLFSIVPRIAFSAFLWGIIASTVLIKQHALIDVAGGIALAEITYRIVYYVLDKQRKMLVTTQSDTSVSLNG